MTEEKHTIWKKLAARVLCNGHSCEECMGILHVRDCPEPYDDVDQDAMDKFIEAVELALSDRIQHRPIDWVMTEKDIAEIIGEEL